MVQIANAQLQNPESVIVVDDDHASSAQAYASEVESLLRQFQAPGDPRGEARPIFKRLHPSCLSVMAIIAFSGCAPACAAAALFLLKSASLHIRPLEGEPRALKADRLVLPASIHLSGPSDQSRQENSLPQADTPEPLRGSIFANAYAAYLPAQPVRRRRHRERGAEKKPLPVLAAIAPPTRQAPFFFETMFGLRPPVSQTAPQT